MLINEERLNYMRKQKEVAFWSDSQFSAIVGVNSKVLGFQQLLLGLDFCCKNVFAATTKCKTLECRKLVAGSRIGMRK